MDKLIMESVKKANQFLKETKDFKKFLEMLEKTAGREDIETDSPEYFRMIHLMFMTHRRIGHMEGEDREYHLLEERKLHEMILRNPYSYLDPHDRISSEFAIKHIDLELAGIPWRESKEEVEEDA